MQTLFLLCLSASWAQAPFVLHRKAVSIAVQVPAGWEVGEQGPQRDFPDYSSIVFVPSGHRGDTGLLVRIADSKPVDAKGQRAILNSHVAEEKRDYPSAKGWKVAKVIIRGVEIWITLIESGGYQFYDAFVPLNDQTLSFELARDLPSGVQRYKKSFIEFLVKARIDISPEARPKYAYLVPSTGKSGERSVACHTPKSLFAKRAGKARGQSTNIDSAGE